jgi:hypothetical protein
VPVKVVRKISLALRAGGSVCGSTGDSARRAKDVAGYDFAPGLLAGVFSNYVFDRSTLGTEFKHPRAVPELIARKEVGIIYSSGLPHFPEDF